VSEIRTASVFFFRIFSFLKMFLSCVPERCICSLFFWIKMSSKMLKFFKKNFQNIKIILMSRAENFYEKGHTCPHSVFGRTPHLNRLNTGQINVELHILIVFLSVFIRGVNGSGRVESHYFIFFI
jgi:hypothetical protein